MNRLALIGLLTAGTLLVQSVVWASPMVPVKTTATLSVPCHGHHVDKAAPAKASCPFCGKHCCCADSCTAPAATMTLAVALTYAVHADFAAPELQLLQLSPHSLDRLRPPIAFQS